MERFCPIGESSWHHMSKKYKADIIQFVRSKFVMPTNERIDKLALGRVGKTWRNYKYTLRQLHFKPNEKAKEQIYNDVPNGRSPSQWIKLVDYWFSLKFQRLSHNGRDACGSLTHMHTTGCTSYANLRVDFFEEEGRELSS